MAEVWCILLLCQIGRGYALIPHGMLQSCNLVYWVHVCEFLFRKQEKWLIWDVDAEQKMTFSYKCTGSYWMWVSCHSYQLHPFHSTTFTCSHEERAGKGRRTKRLQLSRLVGFTKLGSCQHPIPSSISRTGLRRKKIRKEHSLRLRRRRRDYYQNYGNSAKTLLSMWLSNVTMTTVHVCTCIIILLLVRDCVFVNYFCHCVP